MADCISMAAAELDRLAITPGEDGSNATEERLDALEEKINVWSTDESMIWDREPEEASEYLQVVDEIRILTEDLENSQSNAKVKGLVRLLGRAHSSLQTAMARLKDEFVYLLIQNQQAVEPEHMSFRSIDGDFGDDSSNGDFGDDSSSSFDEELIQGRPQVDSGKGAEEFVIDLIYPNAVFDLRCIAEIMFLSNYDKECCQTYIALRKDALEGYLSMLHMEKPSIEEVLKMDWSVLNGMIKRWNRAMKLFVRVYLASEKRLLDLVFADFNGGVREACFLEISKGPILQLLNFGDFGDAIAFGPPKSEKLCRILDMYDGLADLLVDIESLFSEESGTGIITECHEVLLRLGEFVRGNLIEFKSAIHSNTSTTPFAGGGVHPLTKCVMSYAKALTVYNATLISILGNQNRRYLYTVVEDDGEANSGFSPIVPHLQSMTLLLEINLEGRSTLYRDSALQSFFLMNNIFYMVQKVKDSDLQKFLGDEWIRAHNKKFQQHARTYERASWTLALSFLKEEGICNPGSSTPSKAVLKERFKCFNLAFEDVYRAQTAWLIPDLELREDLRISLWLNVLQAYRLFKGRYSNCLNGVRQRDKYIKYGNEDLMNFVLDLSEGSPKVLH